MSHLLDTNIVSLILKNNPRVSREYRILQGLNEKIFVSGITYYEVKRGLLYLKATRQLADFEILYEQVDIVIPDMEIMEIACEIHRDVKARGRPIGDADILTAATAISHRLTIISNDADLLNVTGLTLENWL
jgi:tRNA(fMet)-specific endonuclease VapC